MKYLVTGGAGFIGSHIIEGLLEENEEVACLDSFDPYYDPESKHENIAPFLKNENFELIRGDVTDEGIVEKAIKEADYVIHEAAQAGVRVSVENPFKSYEVNTTGTLNILRASLNSNVKKIVFASSSSVYGKAIQLPFKEDSPKLPVSPYGVSKLAAEQYCTVFSSVYGIKTASLRYFTVYGPRMRPDLAITIFTGKALKDEPIEIFGSGNRTRDFTYISDATNATFLALKKGNGEYNIGSGKRISINELAEKIIEITGSKSEIVHTEARRGDAKHTWADISRAKKELEWKPDVGLNDGLRKYVEWFKNARY